MRDFEKSTYNLQPIMRQKVDGKLFAHRPAAAVLTMAIRKMSSMKMNSWQFILESWTKRLS